MLVPGDPNQMNCSSDALNQLSDFLNNPELSSQTGLVTLGSGLGLSQSGCNASSGTSGNLNVLGLADTAAPIIGQLPLNQSLPVLGSVGDFLLVNSGGTPGFVQNGSTSVSGDCSQTPAVSVSGNEVLPTGSLIDLGQVLDQVTNTGVLDTGTVGDLATGTLSDVTNTVSDVPNTLSDVTSTVTGLDTGTVGDVTNTLNDLSLSTSTTTNDQGQPSLSVSGSDGSGLSVSTDTSTTNDQPSLSVTTSDGSGTDSTISADSSGVNVNTSTSSDSTTTNTCINALGISVNC